ncbi:hypothetical protein [Sporosarcina sp. FSL K6-3457]|uniref:hypothetical protein n=1 Tax=Sporosarcina sp. FSL K6-3457 TaxID=2978204 RepID=UPI0030F4B679
MPKFIVSEVIESRVEYVVEARDAKTAEDALKSYKKTRANGGRVIGEVRYSSTESHITTKELRGVINNG